MSVDLKDLIIPFNDIKLATNNFTNIIGNGGFGDVYKGELLVSGKLTSVAVKRLPRVNPHGQENKEFLTEIQILSRCKHPNVVSLLGVCNEDGERILIYQYAEHESLDKCLRLTDQTMRPLTWMQRINICIGAACGLNYLHNHVAENHRVIHRDVKSANILLDHNWKAMIADFGLSKIGGKNENDSYVVTQGAGTKGYCDPLYHANDILTKESDVYSFGMVLFEVLCGRLAYEKVDDMQFLYQVAPHYYKEGNFKKIIDPYLRDQMDSDSFNKIAKLAYQCVQNEGRPLMSLVVQELEEALTLHTQDPSQKVEEDLRQKLHKEMDARVRAMDARERAIKDRERAMEGLERTYNRGTTREDGETTMSDREKAIEARERQMEDREKNMFKRETATYDREMALYNREKAMENREINMSNRETAIYNREVAVYNREKAMEDRK